MAQCHARHDGRAMWVACNRTRFPATQPRVFRELKIMKIIILIHQIIQEKFAYSEVFMLAMIGYKFMFKMVKKMQNSGLEIVAGLTLPLNREKKLLHVLIKMKVRLCRSGAVTMHTNIHTSNLTLGLQLQLQLHPATYSSLL